SSVDNVSSISITGIPDGATLYDGAGNEIAIDDGSAEVTQEQLDGMSIQPPADSNEDFQLGVTVTTADGDDTATVSQTIDVDVIGVADAPTLEVSLGEPQV